MKRGKGLKAEGNEAGRAECWEAIKQGRWEAMTE